ncbi:Tetratricopeptide repeat/Aspartyl protease [Chthonomonas calidirosea]|uniref:retropepsin-like aspartic protease n=1 Tax=Chthonomonas calidirosea TaxID=454171 RepID=UPI0006DD3BFE|nr:retropepsin-like aspartic protease [Chthonomonas calidirosea]CEK16728.1 Tetratricopeptide repeat/Aspartyl protease [Chthonomonas calidirosea]
MLRFWKTVNLLWALCGLCIGVSPAAWSFPGAAPPSVKTSPTAQSPDPEKLFLQNQFEAAAKAYRQAIQRAPQQIGLRIGLVRTLLRLDRWEEAISEAEAAIRQDPRNADAHGILACALLRAGEPDHAQDEASRSLQLDPKDYWGLIAQGRLYEWNGDDARARTLLLQATDIHPLWPEAWYYVVDEASNKDTLGLSDFVDLASYLSLCPKGHPNTLTMEALPSHLPLLRRLINRTPFEPIAPISQSQMKAVETGGVQSFTVPVKLAGNYVVVPVQIGDVQARLMFDTGGGADITLSSALADKLQLPLISRSLIYGVNGKEPTRIYLAPSMQMGTETFATIPIETSSSLPGNFDGILGVSAFTDYVITIDYTKKTLLFARGKDAKAPPPEPDDYSVTIPFHLQEGDIVVRTLFNAQPTWSLVDTGADAEGLVSLHLARLLQQKMGANSARELQIQGQFGIGTSDTHQKVIVFREPLTLQIESQEGTPLKWQINPAFGADLLDSQINPAEDFEFGGLLGTGFVASAKRATIDYPHRLLVLEYAKGD